MKNPALPGAFAIDIEGEGRFVFNRRNYGAQIRIDATISRILGPFPTDDKVMWTHALLTAKYGALMVDCPPGWEDIELVDLSEDEAREGRMVELYDALEGKLDSFRVRKAAVEAGPAEGADAVHHTGVLGAPEVQHAADRSTVSGDDAGGHRG